MENQLQQAVVITWVPLHNIQRHMIPGRESRGSSKFMSPELCTQVVQWLEQGLTSCPRYNQHEKRIINPGLFPRIEGVSGKVSERFHFHCWLVYG